MYSFNNPELKLDYQPSLISYMSEAGPSIGHSTNMTDSSETVDTDEGIKRYT